MILLDTNAIYYCTGLSSPSKDSNLNIPLLIQELNNSSQFACSSLTVYEILNHYRKNAKVVRRIFSFIRVKKISLIQNPYMPIQYSIKQLAKITQNELNTFLNNEFKVKIEVETRYTLALLLSVFSSNMMIYLKENANITIDDVRKNAIILANEIVVNVGYEVLFDAFVRGYKNQDCEDEVRVNFYGLLECFTQLLCPLVLEHIDTGLDASLDKISLMQQKLRKQIQKTSTSIKYTQKQAKAMSKSKEFKDLIDEIIECSLNRFTSHKVKPAMQKFLQNKYTGMISSGEAFRKNDITDKMLLDDLQPTDIIYTFDGNLRKFLIENQDKRQEYSSSILELKKFGTLKHENI